MRDATVLEVKHELLHYLDFKRLGKDVYDKLTTYQKEKMVLDRLKENRLWSKFTKKKENFLKVMLRKDIMR